MDKGFEVDTVKVRATAKKVKAAAANVSELASQDVAAMLRIVDGDLKGDTAVALKEVLEELKTDISKIASALNTIQRALNTYAAKIEEKDAELAETING